VEAATLKALNGSITKWRRIVAGKLADGGHRNCPLCTLFFDGGCRGCPVAAKTGKSACDDTPYRDQWVVVAGEGLKAIEPEAIAAAQAELDFLISLRPSRKGRQSTS
jgi:hypothetical protein